MSLEVCSVTFVKGGPFELEKFSFLPDQKFFGQMHLWSIRCTFFKRLDEFGVKKFNFCKIHTDQFFGVRCLQ